MKWMIFFPKNALLGAIQLYQRTLSPDHGYFSLFFPQGYCKFFPSCSEYMYQAVEKKGVILGVCLGSVRVLRCNPFLKGGIHKVSD
ncbi:MAG TPA: membrane protein insertion efficiency factor YidD [Patescibacteria group bacterium]|nr:membrane protein insertion efficiency factor YidD [Patescibacteria group bacterium]